MVPLDQCLLLILLLKLDCERMARLSKIRKRMEVKYTQPVKTVSTAYCGAADATTPGNTRWNLWQSFMPLYTYSGNVGRSAMVFANGRWSEFSDNISFEESVFTPGPHNASQITDVNCGISQGTGTHQRIGREVNVVKDKWRFHLSIPNKDPTTGAANAFSLGNRRIKVRLMCIYRKRLNVSDKIYLDPTEIFDDPFSLRSTFKADQSGYVVVYDKVVSLTASPAQQGVTNWVTNSAGLSSRLVEAKQDAYLKFSSFPYVLAWADENTTGRFQPYTEYDEEVVQQKYHGGGAPTLSGVSPGKILKQGVTQGVFQWFYYLEDIYGDTLTSTYPAAASDPADPRAGKYVVATPYHGVRMDIERVTKYTDA